MRCSQNINPNIWFYARIFLILLLLPYSCFASNSINPELSTKTILNQFIPYAEQARKDWHVPGMAIAIVQDGKIIYAQGFGRRNAKGEQVTENTIFDIASLTKSFTATLMAMQIDEGKYEWATRILELSPSFRLYNPKTTQEFEVQDLLVHDSGLPSESTTISALEDFGYTIDHILYTLRFIKPVDPFRTTFAYQNIFPMLAGEIIQKLSGESYAAYLHHRLFVPVQMDHSFHETEEKLYQQENLAQPFAYVSETNVLEAYPINPSYQSKRRTSENAAGSSGGIYSSATDLAKWLIFNMNNGLVGKDQLVSVKNMNFIHTPQSQLLPSSNPEGKPQEVPGQGWFIDTAKYPPYTVLYHTGGGMGMHAIMAYIPEKKVGIVILTNNWGNKVPEALYQRFFDLYLEITLKDWSKVYQENQAAEHAHEKAESKNPQCKTLKEPDLDRYVGTYHNPIFGDLKLSKEGSNLRLHIGPMDIIWRLTYCQKNLLQADWPNPYGMKFTMISSSQSFVEFIEGKNKEVQKMIVPYLNGEGNGIFVKK
ncbi:MAG: serine hydrolase [Alphaproteobacteria bacterium]|nr:serine hydrolase [Alphaproteobacteria bacterium]